jgi:hypothetical protein
MFLDGSESDAARCVKNEAGLQDVAEATANGRLIVDVRKAMDMVAKAPPISPLARPRL